MGEHTDMGGSVETTQHSMSGSEIRALEERARSVRRSIVTMLAHAGSGHPGGSLSVTDLLTALYFTRLRHRPSDPRWADRDRVVLSKGHAAPALYAILAESGYFPREQLLTLRKLGSMLQGHPDRTRTPGIESSTGSLGQGISVAVGMALAGKLDKKAYRVYAFLGDGELQEGEVWEASMAGAHYKLDNLCAVIDFNGFQIDGRVQEIMNPEPIPEKWEAFGWAVREIDGHNMREIVAAYDWAMGVKGKPAAVVAHTIKGKGVSFMESKAHWHGVPPSAEEAARALEELGEA